MREREVVAGRNPVLEALRAGRRVHRLAVGRGVREDGAVAEILRLAAERSVPLSRVLPADLDRLADGATHQGVVALVDGRPSLSLEDVLARARSRGEDPFLIVLDRVEDPHNLGAVLRVADGAGAHAVVVPERGSAKLTTTVHKTSAGASEWVPVVVAPSTMVAVDHLKRAGVWVGGAEADATKDYWDERLTGPLAIVLGSEGAGISAPVRKHLDFVVRIPMAGKVSSLNVSVASALLAYERARQRTKGPG
ncbi:MAG TPA: 23S rRNA (guanosine(2251)-2'-O)-methyltransferase RlmB [Candidatus Thermoplasmatota archaeon]|nr:23S rRNA (guanosine(2251)-2'-O)-methyltransferase RlmB [Candidatus Thermoplasmatota archaeon]